FGEQGRTDGREGIKTLSTAELAATIFLLPIARGYIIRDRVAEHVIESRLASDIFTVSADNDRELSFIVYFCAGPVSRDSNRVAQIGRAHVCSSDREHVTESRLASDIFTVSADNDRELSFIVYFCAGQVSRDSNRVA